MRSFGQTITSYKSISWILITAVLMTVILPAHYHLHHLDSLDAAGHAHSIDLHLLADDRGHSHHHDEASIISATPDAMVKKDKSVFSVFIPLVIFLVLLLTRGHRISSMHGPGDTPLVRLNDYFSPSLRAPPLS
jgi:hypothetical protein